MSETRERPVIHVRHMAAGAVGAYVVGVLMVVGMWSGLKNPPSFYTQWINPLCFTPLGAMIGWALNDAFKTWRFRW